MSLIIARRVANILPHIINPAQQGFIKGRSAVNNIRKVICALEQVKTHPSEDIAIITIDAFDSIQLPWLFLVLQKIGLQGQIFTFFQQLYKSPTVLILTTGTLSAPIPLQKGTTQGCALSPLLFNLAIEPLLLYINSTPPSPA